MAISTKINFKNLILPENIFIFAFFVVFPFGQIIRIGIFHPLDIVTFFAAIYAIANRLEKPEIFKYLELFLLFALSSWIFSVFLFWNYGVFYGLLYLIRLFSYFYFLVYVFNFTKRNLNKDLLKNSLIAVSTVAALFGWIQYFTVPNMKPFFTAGWDMHLYRVVGTFLDPSYLGLIIVFGLILSISELLNFSSCKKLLIPIFLLVTLAFTYSRSSFLALFVALVVFGIYKKSAKYLTGFILGLFVLILILPTSRNESVKFFRSFSTTARLDNYKSTLTIFKQSPIFGIGLNNMCFSYNKYIGFQKYTSHSCSGSDSSLLFILATTGISGIIIFIYSVKKIIQKVMYSKNKVIILASFAALFVHSLFSNSLFYPWILGWVVILLAEV